MATTQKMTVSKTVKGKDGKGAYVPVGEVSYWLPALEDTGLTGFAPAADNEDEGIKNGVYTEDGTPAYADERHQFLFNALHAAVKGINKNRLIKDSVTLKDGANAPIDWETLLEKGQRGGNAEALQFLRELKESFATWLLTTGKSEKVRKALQIYFNGPDTLSIQDDATKDKVVIYLENFSTMLADTDLIMLEKAQKHLQKLLDAAEPSVTKDENPEDQM